MMNQFLWCPYCSTIIRFKMLGYQVDLSKKCQSCEHDGMIHLKGQPKTLDSIITVIMAMAERAGECRITGREDLIKDFCEVVSELKITEF